MEHNKPSLPSQMDQHKVISEVKELLSQLAATRQHIQAVDSRNALKKLEIEKKQDEDEFNEWLERMPNLKSRDGHKKSMKSDFIAEWKERLAAASSNESKKIEEVQSKGEKPLIRMCKLLDFLNLNQRSEIFHLKGFSVAAVAAYFFNFDGTVIELPSKSAGKVAQLSNENTSLKNELEAIKSQLEVEKQERKKYIEEIEKLETSLELVKQGAISQDNEVKNLTRTLAEKKSDISSLQEKVNKTNIELQKTNKDLSILVLYTGAIYVRNLEDSKRVRINGIYRQIPDLPSPDQVAIFAGNRAVHSGDWEVVQVLYKRGALTESVHGADIRRLFTFSLQSVVRSSKLITIINIMATMRGNCKSWTRYTNSKEVDNQTAKLFNDCRELYTASGKQFPGDIVRACKTFDGNPQVAEKVKLMEKYREESCKLERQRIAN